MKTIRKSLAFILVLSMIFALCVPALADAAPEKKPYKYVSLGASNTLGYGLHGYWPLPLYDDPYDGVFKNLGDGDLTVSRDGYFTSGYYYYSQDAYPVLVKNALQERLGDGYDVSLKQCAINSMRAYDLLTMLDDSWPTDGYYEWRLGSGEEGWKYDIERERHQVISVDGWDDIVIDKGKTDLRQEMQDALYSANFITYDLGANDFGSYLLNGMMINWYFDCDLNKVTDGYAKQFYAARDAVKKALTTVTGGALSPELFGLIEHYTDSFAYAYLGFIRSFDRSMELIYGNNPDVDIVVLSIGNFLYGTTASLGAVKLPLGAAVNVLIDLANSYLAIGSPYHSRYSFANASSNGHVEFFRDKMLEWNGNVDDLHFCIKDAFCGYDSNFVSGHTTKLALEKLGIAPGSERYDELYKKGLDAQLYALAYFCRNALKSDNLMIANPSAAADFVTPMRSLCYEGDNSVLIQALTTDDTLDAINARAEQYIDENLLCNDAMKAAAYLYVYTRFANCFFSHPSYEGHIDLSNAVMHAYDKNISGLRAIIPAVGDTVGNITQRTVKGFANRAEGFFSGIINAVGLRSLFDSIIKSFNRLTENTVFNCSSDFLR